MRSCLSSAKRFFSSARRALTSSTFPVFVREAAGLGGEHFEFHLEADVGAADLAGVGDDLVALVGEILELGEQVTSLVQQFLIVLRRVVEQRRPALRARCRAFLAGGKPLADFVALLDEFPEVPVLDGERLDVFDLLPDRRAEIGLRLAQQVHLAGGITHALGSADIAEGLGDACEKIAGGGHGSDLLCEIFRCRLSITEKSSSVVTLPETVPVQTSSLSRRRMILPERVLGRPGAK